MYNNQHSDRPGSFDMLQLLAVLGLMAISVAFVYSATMANESTNALAWYHQSYFKQIIWFALGGAGACALCVIDYHVFTRWSLLAYWLAILTLIAVILPFIGSLRFGARRWIDLGGFQFQPSEFAKLAFILAAANFLSRPVDELRQRGNFWKAIGMMVLPFLLIMKEPDLGSALVLLPTGLGMMFVAGTPKRYLLQLIGVAGLLAALFIGDVVFAPPRFRIPMHAYQVRRLLVYFGRDYSKYSGTSVSPTETKKLKAEEDKDSYNVQQSLIAVGSGGCSARVGGRGGKTRWGSCRRRASTTISFSQSSRRRKASSAA
jgi:cell division protein FtsW (lipid II flippase)